MFGMGEMIFEIARAAIEKYAVARDASGNRLLREVIPSTMGEPLLYSHFDELLEFCRLIGIPLNLTTNGTFPGKWAHESAMELLLLSCSDIKVSHLASEQFDGWKANVEKLVRVRDKLRENDIESVTIVRMEVPCCGGLEMAAKKALQASGKFIPWQVVTISRDGNILD